MRPKMLAPRRTGPIRQLSLQQQPPARHHQIRRQRSADDGEKISPHPRFTRNPTPKSDNERPKVRVAWAEQTSKSSVNEENGVQIVARQIPSKSRSAKKSVFQKSNCFGDKPSILYSHQQLAERLRQAWKQREESKSNIDIFLAHKTVEDRCDSVLLKEDSEEIRDTGFFNESGAEEEKENRERLLKKSLSLDDKGKDDSPKTPLVPDQSLAKLKRAQFQSRQNKAFTGPIIERFPKEPCDSKPGRAISSAPSQRRSIDARINVVIDAQCTSRKDFPDKPNEENDTTLEVTSCDERLAKSAVSNRPMKSSASKRRVRSSKRRSYSSNEDGTVRGKGRGGKIGLENGKIVDVVTMVSLISSDDSESDGEDERLIYELRNQLPTAPIIKTSARPATGDHRRTVKSVSFHQDSFDDQLIEIKCQVVEDKKTAQRVFETKNPWKAEDVILTLPLLQIPQDTETEAPLTDREKRCLVVPICDLRDKKRKLLRTGPKLIETQKPPIKTKDSPPVRSTFTALQEITIVKSLDNSLVSTTKSDRETDTDSCEPFFQNPKEKECWHLYKKMCDKGVCVSFDTVLRGMLTPTEYRLRQRNIQSQNIQVS